MSYGSPFLEGPPQALSGEPDVSVRYNGLKGGEVPSGAQRVPWCGAGCYLQGRPAFTFDPALHQGLYYVQDASSMFIHHLLRNLTSDGVPVRYLDACAAPGGKTTAAMDALPEGSVVVANEFVPARASVLRENLAKWGYPLVTVTQGDTSRFTGHPASFDIIAADVPCSGEGMMRKDAEAVSQWSAGLVRQCAARQREIVEKLWPALRPGGYFIYSTCTFNRLENEEMVMWMRDTLGAQPVEVDVDPGWNIVPAIDCDVPCFRFIPGRIRGEGLFMAVLRKGECGGDTTASAQKVRKKDRGSTKSHGQVVPGEVRRWLEPGFEGRIEVAGDTVRAVPDIRWDGFPFPPAVEIGVVKGRDVIPTQALALSTLMDKDAFARVEVDYATAMAYLRCEAVSLDSSAPRGVVLLEFGGHPLGFVKNVGNRANNLYPKQWRILSQSVPAEYVSIDRLV